MRKVVLLSLVVVKDEIGVMIVGLSVRMEEDETKYMERERDDLLTTRLAPFSGSLSVNALLMIYFKKRQNGNTDEHVGITV